jgi:dTDP-glucose 4,6-dehydratase
MISKKILITGESGFIGSHLINLFTNKYPNYEIHGLDKLTYAANKNYTKHLENKTNYKFHKVDIFNREDVFKLIHLAAESHVDNSIANPLLFVETNIVGTLNLLDAFRSVSSGRFHHVSTDEVYGDLNEFDSAFTEKNPYNPSSPYSASKASSDLIVRAYHRTYNINIVITNCSNNYGPHQHHEKFIPTIISSILHNKQIPIYGSGKNIRDWLHVEDHVEALDLIFHQGHSGETYNIGANNEVSNLELVYLISDICLEKKIHQDPRGLISFVKDRLGHDNRYAICSKKLYEQLKWQSSIDFKQGLSMTIDWYMK